MEKILYYGEGDFAGIQKIAAQMRICTVKIETSFLNRTLSALADNRPSGAFAPFSGTAPKERLLVFCGVSEKHLDRILFLLRRSGEKIDYKAVLTPVNADWTVLRLLLELGREKKYT